ncbi:MAG: cysteine desulfurase-like protein [Cyclobacteriaceae bacterium]|jgi:cysteine desulfurase family protein (TIGR01976 family)|nr:cysteine desulfurase-like protein [Cyclobacteriaceae bacterium]
MSLSGYNPLNIRQHFPSLERNHENGPLVFFDGPAGTQVPDAVIDAISNYYRQSNANTHGTFLTTNETDQVVHTMRRNMVALLNAEHENCISIGQNMTTLNFSLARAMARVLKPGDEVLITQLDHEANRGPWLTLRDAGVKVREVKLLPSGLLDYEDFEKKVNENTRLVCMGMSANSIGTVNDFHFARKLTYKHNAWLLLDAVHYAPHFSIDVQHIGCDFLLCSAYKFYGPHVGILYTKPGILDRLPTDRLRTAGQTAPESIETGTLNHAAIAGVAAAVDFIAGLGKGDTLRDQLVHAYYRISSLEFALAARLYEGLSAIPGIKVIGQDFSTTSRTPTVSFTMEGKKPLRVCTQLAAKNIFAWDGHFYAMRAIEVLGLLERGGVTRMGISMYNTMEEVEYVLEEVNRIARS